MTAPNGRATPFALKHSLRRQRSPYVRSEVEKLPTDRCGVYALWLPSQTQGALADL